ncbi:MAG: hypothetical protein WC455_14675 [Dehalococcoidia bacterium]|jgi:hypothetical protein
MPDLTPEQVLNKLTPRHGIVVTMREVREYYKKFGTDSIAVRGKFYKVGNRPLCPGLREMYLVEQL